MTKKGEVDIFYYSWGVFKKKAFSVKLDRCRRSTVGAGGGSWRWEREGGSKRFVGFARVEKKKPLDPLRRQRGKSREARLRGPAGEGEKRGGGGEVFSRKSALLLKRKGEHRARGLRRGRTSLPPKFFSFPRGCFSR